MNKRTAFWFAWFTWALYLVIAIVTLLLQIPHSPSQWFSDLFAALVLLAFATVGSLIASRRPENPIGWLFCTGTLLWAGGDVLLQYTTSAFMTVSGSSPEDAFLGVFGDWARGMGWFLMLTFGLLLFPTGHLPSPRWRFLARLIAGLLVAYSIALLLSPYPYANLDPGLATVRNPLGILVANDLFDYLANWILLLLYSTILACIIAVFLRFQRARGVERQQLKWFAYGMTLSILMLIVIVILMFSNVTSGPLATIPFYLAVVCIPISAGIAILKYRLYDIDVLISRTLVYGLLTASIIGMYVFVVGYLGALFRTGTNLPVSLFATGVVAVLFQPLRGLLQRGTNRLFYGQRDEPYAVITRLSGRLEATLTPDTVLSTIVETVSQALKLPYAAILLQDEETLTIAASYGHQPAEPLTFPLVYQRETIGQLQLAPRSPGEAFTPADVHLLQELTHQVSLVARTVRLTADLQRSNEHLQAARARLVTTREEERRRLRRDLHDGLGPTLAALALTASAVSDLIPTRPETAVALANALQNDIRATVGDIRRLVYELRPPALDELGLIPAIRERAAQFSNAQQNGAGSAPAAKLLVHIEASENLPALSAAVEVAAYRIVQEALTNVARHAQAHTCAVRFSLNDELEIEISDDGIGLPQEHQVGVGLLSMRERAAELGGSCVIEKNSGSGTRVCARLPIAKE